MIAARRILLVEDDRFLRRACEASLRLRSFSVAVAADGVEALRQVRAERPDLILTNLSVEQTAEEIMNLGVSGYLVKANRSRQKLGDRVTRLLGG